MRSLAFVLLGPACFGMTFVLTAPASASDTPPERASLKGVQAVQVVVERMAPDAERDGLTKSLLQTEVEARLRQAGIEVKPSGDPYLYVAIDTRKSKSGVYTYMVRVQFCQAVTLWRDPTSIRYGAITWDVGGFGQLPSPRLQEVRSDLADYVDKFINAYLEQNPKK